MIGQDKVYAKEPKKNRQLLFAGYMIILPIEHQGE
jgi:hypothetical protein